jgi:hypothetical protein
VGPLLLVPLLLGAALDTRVCVEERAPAPVLERLGRYLRTLRIDPRCGEGVARIRITATTLTFERPDGTARRRKLPWRLDPEGPLRSAAGQGRLSELSVMIEALALEPVAGLLPPPSVASMPVAPRPAKRRRRRPAPVVEVAPESEPAPTPPWPPIHPQTRAVASAVRAPQWAQSRYAVGVQSWLRYRTPGVATWELAAELSRDGWFVRASGAPTATWALDGRPIRLAAFGATGGYRGGVELGRYVELAWSAGLSAETLRVTRDDIADAADHTSVDIGGVAGVGATVRADALAIALFAEGLVFPTARDIVIPDGPSARVNRWGARVGLQVAWSFFGSATKIERGEDQNRRTETSAP